MKSKKLILSLLFGLVILTIVYLSSGLAQQKEVTPLIKPDIIKPDKIPPIIVKADLSIFAVGNKHWENRECSACSNILARVGALYLNDLTVGVMCNSSKVRQVNGIVKVTYYDISQGKTVTKTKPFNVSCRQPRDTLVTIVNHPLLIKRSTGIRAEVTPIKVVDPNPANNVKTENNPNNLCVHHMIY